MMPGITAGHPVSKSAPPIAGFWGIESHSGGDVNANNLRFGWRFTVGASDLVCNRLRVRAASGGSDRVRIHRVSDGALIATADIATAGVSTWAEATLSDFTLVSGVAYTCSSRVVSGSRSILRNETITVYTGVTKTANVGGSGDGIPTSSQGSTYTFCDFGYQ